ncbi:MAG: SAM-dependent methyltransferase, partial [Pseudomonadales bacterium]
MVASDHLERSARRIRLELVVAAEDADLTASLDPDLGCAEQVPSGVETDDAVADRPAFTVPEALVTAGGQTTPHHSKSIRCREVSLRAGALTLVDEQGAVHRFGDPAGELRATLTVRDPSFYGALGLGGSVGAGESYFRGAWDTDGLVDLVRLMARNSDVLSQLDGGFARLGRLLYNAFHWRHANTVAGSRANILAHYDLGNDFFELMLDDSMMYSSAIYADEAMALPAAQAHKLKIICEKLRLDSSHHLLEIGTGWGGLAGFAAKETGCRVTTTTISDAQFSYAKARVRAAGLEDRVTVLKQDYRVLTGRFDRIVSIEMIEAVGDQFFTTYFRKLDSLLAEDGLL